MNFRNWILQNFPLLEDDFDALTDYELFCKMLEYIKGFAKDNEEFKKQLEIYENYFNNYSSKVILSAGELIINNYVFNIDKTIYYYLPKKEWKEYKVIYYLNTIENVLEVYLDNKIECIFINKYVSNEIRINN